jgi:DNA-binding response OmpR family regulator
MNKKLLLIEDERPLAGIIADSLITEGFEVECIHDGRLAFERLQHFHFDIMVVDVMLPGMDGFSLVKKFRAFNRDTPIIFLTSKTMPHDVVKGFECGANDYLKKPFGMEELVIRLKVLLSSSRMMLQANTNQVFNIGKYRFDSVKQQLIFQKDQIPLTSRESEILLLLCLDGKTLVPKQKILNAIWGSDNFFHSRTLDVFITRLRKYLKEDPEVQIINLRGLGYKLVW